MRHALGFTLIELLTVIAIVAIVTTVAVPGVGRIIARNRLVADVNNLNAHLQLARSEAIRRGQQVVMCKSRDGRRCTATGGWEQGWITFSDPNRDEYCEDHDADGICDADGGELIRIAQPGASPGITIHATGNPAVEVAYQPSGFAEGYLGTFSVCDGNAGEAPRGLTLIMSGRLRAVDGTHAGVSCP